jgi:hypothetical protein
MLLARLFLRIHRVPPAAGGTVLLAARRPRCQNQHARSRTRRIVRDPGVAQGEAA